MPCPLFRKLDVAQSCLPGKGHFAAVLTGKDG
jgi:hypothetical protein